MPNESQMIDRPVAPGRSSSCIACWYRFAVRVPAVRLLLPAKGEHVGRDIAAVDVQTGAQQGKQQAARAAGQIEGRLSVVLDERSVEGKLVRIGLVELRPPAGHEPVVPGSAVASVMRHSLRNARCRGCDEATASWPRLSWSRRLAANRSCARGAILPGRTVLLESCRNFPFRRRAPTVHPAARRSRCRSPWKESSRSRRRDAAIDCSPLSAGSRALLRGLLRVGTARCFPEAAPASSTAACSRPRRVPTTSPPTSRRPPTICASSSVDLLLVPGHVGLSRGRHVRAGGRHTGAAAEEIAARRRKPRRLPGRRVRHSLLHRRGRRGHARRPGRRRRHRRHDRGAEAGRAGGSCQPSTSSSA